MIRFCHVQVNWKRAIFIKLKVFHFGHLVAERSQYGPYYMDQWNHRSFEILSWTYCGNPVALSHLQASTSSSVCIWGAFSFWNCVGRIPTIVNALLSDCLRCTLMNGFSISKSNTKILLRCHTYLNSVTDKSKSSSTFGNRLMIIQFRMLLA